MEQGDETFWPRDLVRTVVEKSRPAFPEGNPVLWAQSITVDRYRSEQGWGGVGTRDHASGPRKDGDPQYNSARLTFSTAAELSILVAKGGKKTERCHGWCWQSVHGEGIE